MQFIKDKKIMVMTLVDLEHCGFCYQDYLGELFMHGIDDKEAETPILLMVDFVGGAIITTGTPDETLDKMEDAHEEFKKYLEKVKS